jgi:DNA-directed RNA polymerase subunit RPC12/RpoP
MTVTKTGIVQAHTAQVERCPHCGKKIVLKASVAAHVEAQERGKDPRSAS